MVLRPQAATNYHSYRLHRLDKKNHSFFIIKNSHFKITAFLFIFKVQIINIKEKMPNFLKITFKILYTLHQPFF